MREFTPTTSVIDGRLNVQMDDGTWRVLPSGADGEATTGGDAAAGDASGETPTGEVAPAADAAEGTATETGDGEGEAQAETVLPDLPEDLQAAAPEDLSALYESIGEARDALRQSARTSGDLERINEATRRRAAVRDELQRRVDEERNVREGLDALDTELANEGDLPEPALALASVSGRPSAAQLAAARGAQPPAGQRPPALRPQGPRQPLLASVSDGRVQVGGEMSMGEFGAALDRVKRGQARTIVASLPSFDETPNLGVEVLGSGSDARNTEMMREAQDSWRAREFGGDARVAAICEPFDVIRAIPDAFVTDEPVSAMFPTRPIGHLAWRYLQSVSLASVLAGVAEWSDADQDSVDPDDSETWKACADVDCPDVQTAKATFLTACLTWAMQQEMSNPEHLANVMNALNAVRARVKEAFVLKRIDKFSHKYEAAPTLGAVPAVIEVLNTALGLATYNERISLPAYQVILPPNLVQIMAIDEAGKGFAAQDVTDILAYVKARVPGVRSFVQSLDASADGQPGLPVAGLNPIHEAARTLPPLTGHPQTAHRLRIIDPSAALYGETGQLNVGTTRDSQLLRQNRVQYFAEEGLLLEKNGPQPWISVDVTLCANGARAGWVDPAECS